MVNYPELRIENPNIYLIKKREGYVMIDCGGFDPEKDFNILCDELHSRKINPEEIKDIFLTHTHKDHSLLAEKIQRLTCAKIYLGRSDFLRISDDINAYRKAYGRVRHYLRYWGFDENMTSRFFRSFERQSHSARLDRENTILLDKDTEIDSLRIIMSPGHTSGSICIYDSESELLFTGDTLLKKIVLVPVIEYDRDIEDGISMLLRHTDTLKMISKIGYKYIYPGHGELIPADVPVIDTIFSYIERRSKRVLTLIEKGRNTIYSIAEALYQNGVLNDVVFKEAPLVYVSDLMMPLEYLNREGRIRVDNGIIKVI